MSFAGVIISATVIARVTNRHHPRKRMIQYCTALDIYTNAGDYWIPAFAGMTVAYVARAQLLNENPATAAGCVHCVDDGFSGPDCRGAGAGRHAAVRSAPGRPAWHVSGGTRHWPDSSDHGSDRTVAGRPDASPVPGCSEYSLRPE